MWERIRRDNFKMRVMCGLFLLVVFNYDLNLFCKFVEYCNLMFFKVVMVV